MVVCSAVMRHRHWAGTQLRPLSHSIAGAILLALATAAGCWLDMSSAAACGGFFCGQQPVDQTAERILFEVNDGSVTMTTQISYSGRAEDFAWVLPLSEPPAVDSLKVFSQQALVGLDSNTGPIFLWPQDSACSNQDDDVVFADSSAAGGPGGVDVYLSAEVGPYEAVVVGSTDASALVSWLRERGYRITPAMDPYVARYVDEGMKFLALKLQDTATVQDLKPFQFTLPGSVPSIPLRMTALAAEPEMSILVFVLASQRYEGKNWSNLAIADDQIRWQGFDSSVPFRTNWAELVAQAVDRAGGQGWVTEFAGPSASYAGSVRQQLQSGGFVDAETEQAARELLASFERHPYLTRLYTRVSAEEMHSDPIFGASDQGEVDRLYELSRFVNGDDQCARRQLSRDPCDFNTCGAGGLCRPVAARSLDPGASRDAAPLAGCACAPGASARATQRPDGSLVVVCQDARLSFLNPGDREADSLDTLPDPCATAECGEHGQCVSVNLTPTCVCDQGYVAVPVGTQGSRSTRCVEPAETVPRRFYATALVDLPELLPGGRDVELVPTPAEPAGGYPTPSSSGGGGCAVAPQRHAGAQALWLLAAAAALGGARRRAGGRWARRRKLS
jgi:hypothetical protein